MIIAKKIFLGGLMAAFLICQAQREELSTRQKAAAGTSFVTVGIFSGYLAYTRNQKDSWITTLFNLCVIAPLGAVGGTMLIEAFTEVTDQNLVNEAYEAHCLAMRRYKGIIDHWNSGHSTLADLAPLITIPIDSYLFSLRKMICTLHEQEDAIKVRLLNPFDNVHAQKLFKQLLHGIIETHAVLDKIYMVLSENTIYFVENLGEDSILEEVATTTEEAVAITESSEDTQADSASATEQEIVVINETTLLAEEQQAIAITQEVQEASDANEVAFVESEEIIEIIITLNEEPEQDEPGDTIPWSELTPAPSHDEETIPWSELTPVPETQEEVA